MLPGPVQHVLASAVHSVTPFEMPDPDKPSTDHGVAEGPGETTTTVGTDGTTTPTTRGPDGHGDGHGEGDGNGVATPTTTGDHPGDPSTTVPETPTTEHHGDGGGGTTGGGDGGNHGGDGGGDGGNHGGGDTTTTVPQETPTTEHHNPESISLHCEASPDAVTISCSWNASTNPDHTKYLLLRIQDNDTKGRVVMQSEDALSFTDSTVQAGVGYGYRVVSLRADGSTETHSNMFTIECCGTPSGGGGGGDGGNHGGGDGGGDGGHH